MRDRPSFFRVLYLLLRGGPSAVIHGQAPKISWREVVRFVAIFGAILVLPLVIQAVFRPWARSFIGAPTLSGGWFGEGTTPSGRKELIYLTVRPFLWDEDCYRGCGFDGIANVCTADHTTQPYTIKGDVDNRRASTFSISFTKEDERHYDFRLREMTGQWPGGNSIKLAGKLEFDRSRWSTTEVGVWIDDQEQKHPYDRADRLDLTIPMTFTLRRGRQSDFLAACGR